MTNRPQLARYQGIQKILRQARKGGAKVTAGILATEMEVSVRTIMRDLNTLRDDHGAPLTYDESAKTWQLDKAWSFQPIKLSEGELLQLAVSAQLASHYRGTPLAKNLDRLFKKLQQVLDEPVDIDPDFTSEHVSFFHQPARNLQPGVWEALMKALRSGKRVRMQYRKFGHPEAVPVVVDPLHLSCREGDWYLIAQRLDKDEPWIYAMSRIENVEVQLFSSDLHSFDPTAFFAKSTGRWVPLTEKPVKAKMKFSDEVAEFISEREWHADQKMVRHRNGTVTLTRLFGSMWEAKKWVLMWGADVHVMTPPKLAEEVAAEARDAAELYS